MRIAEKADQKLVVGIITESFIDNPSVISVITEREKGKKYRLSGLAKYVFKTAHRRKGVFISNDEKAVAVCYQYNAKKESLFDYWNQVILAVSVVGLSRVIKVLKREAYIKKKRPKSGNFLYFWFFGVTKDGQGKGAASELWKAVLKEAESKSLPIYLETSVEKNKTVYQRFGFELYHTWHNNKKNMTLWFMKYEHNPNYS